MKIQSNNLFGAMRSLFLLIAILLGVNAQAQINHIGKYVDKKWLDSEFGSNYIVTAGQFDRETGYLVGGRISVGNMELSTSRNGRCDMVSIEKSISVPNKIQEDAERFFSDNNCSGVKRSVHDGINGDLLYELTYEAERIIGGRVISLTAKARGSYNSFGAYFPSFYRQLIVTSGL
ncbi:MAG: hypothetical protein IKU04_05615 [Bacteroidales bacterium]|nr:hypothetical protein [Bacteroidales bacterium]